jgi:hypothetical protein
MILFVLLPCHEHVSKDLKRFQKSPGNIECTPSSEVILVILEILIHVIIKALEDHELFVLGIRLIGHNVSILNLTVLQHTFAADLGASANDTSGENGPGSHGDAVHHDAAGQPGTAGDVGIRSNHTLLYDALLFNGDVHVEKAVTLGDRAALSDTGGVGDLVVVSESRSGRTADFLGRFQLGETERSR